MRGLNFAPATLDGNLDASMAGNGILDADEMALVSAILADPKLDLRSKGGVDHALSPRRTLRPTHRRRQTS